MLMPIMSTMPAISQATVAVAVSFGLWRILADGRKTRRRAVKEVRAQ